MYSIYPFLSLPSLSLICMCTHVFECVLCRHVYVWNDVTDFHCFPTRFTAARSFSQTQSSSIRRVLLASLLSGFPNSAFPVFNDRPSPHSLLLPLPHVCGFLGEGVEPRSLRFYGKCFTCSAISLASVVYVKCSYLTEQMFYKLRRNDI